MIKITVDILNKNILAAMSAAESFSQVIVIYNLLWFGMKSALKWPEPHGDMPGGIEITDKHQGATTMKHLLKSCLVSAGLLLGATAANAGLIEHKLELNQFVEYGATYGYTHNVNLDPTFNGGNVVSGTLSIELIDTDNLSLIEFGAWMATLFNYSSELTGPDYATVVVGALDGDTGEFSTEVSGMWTVALGQAALAALNASGELGIWVSGFGMNGAGSATLDDLNIGTSTLTLVTQDVPAPATLALFGLGLAGLGAVRRRRAAA